MNRRWLFLAAGLVCGIAFTLVAQSWWQRSIAAPVDTEDARGPHGGRVLSNGGLALEVVIFETGVLPHYRVYPTDAAGTPLRLADVRLSATIARLGGRLDRLEFTEEADYLRSTGAVEEPHSFDVTFTAVVQGVTYALSYEQVEGRATIPDAALASTGIGLETAGPGTLRTTVDLPGEITVPPGRRVVIAARADGLLSLLMVSVGQRVRQGDLIAVVVSRDLAIASASYVTAVSRERYTRTLRDRERELATRRITAQQDLLAAEQAWDVARTEVSSTREVLAGCGLSLSAIEALPSGDSAQYSRLSIVAPHDGIVTEQSATVGEHLGFGAPVVTLTDTREVWVTVQVHPRDLDAVTAGRRVRVSAVGVDSTRFRRFVTGRSCSCGTAMCSRRGQSRSGGAIDRGLRSWPACRPGNVLPL